MEIFFVTGSYALDLMSWKDIDVQVHYTSRAAIDEYVYNLSKDKDVREIKYINFVDHPKKQMPTGYYCGAKIRDKESNDYWKFDVWFFDKEESFLTNVNFINKLLDNLSPEKRDLILSMKFQAQEEQKRPPQMFSYYLYQVVALENLVNPDEINTYLITNNVDV